MSTINSDSKKSIRIFAWASFLNDLGSDIIYPIWPFFVTTILKANMATLGFLDGLGEALVAFSQAASGYFSDRFKKRKIFIWTGYLCGSLSRIGYSISTIWPHLIPFRVLDRAGKIRSAPRDAIVADISTDKNRGKNFGFLRAMDHLGAVCGICICIVFFKLLGYRFLFAIAAIPSLASALLIFLFIHEKRPMQAKTYKVITLKDFDKNFRLFLILSAIYSLGAFSYSFLLIYAKVFGFKVTFAPVLYLIFTASASIFSIPFGKLSDKIGRKPVLLISYLFWATVCISIIFFQKYFMVFLTFILYGAHKGAIEPVQRSFVSELSPAEFRASSLGGFQMVVGLCALPASFIAGVLWEEISMQAPFYFSLFLTFISGIMLFFVKKRKFES
ncbi:MAG: MFS transporter [Candidatus Aminicenantes bacterium]|nr:MFS transporter [Candidatus Aminicenantes bacterium]